MKTTRRTALSGWLVAAAVLLCGSPAHAKLARTGDASVVVHLKATAGITFDARTSDLRVTEAADGLTLVVPLATLKTGIARRDKDMREKYLHVDRFPDAVLKVQRTALKFPEPDKQEAGAAPASLSLHGHTRPVTISYTARRAGDVYAIQGSTSIDMRDFGIEPPVRFGLKVQPALTIKVGFQATDP
jgi:polyisoprenoid-binding protein YceI